MTQPVPMPQDSPPSASRPAPPLSRRNLPRASQACQWCRAKKAKCDQRQPCSNCIKHSVGCAYGVRRRNGQSRSIRDLSQGLEQRSDPSRVDHFRSPASTQGNHSERAGSNGPEQAHGSARSVFPLQTQAGHDADVVGDVNQHTHGTEFYGTSSNFVLLNQLFAYAQQHLPPGHTSSGTRNETSYLSPSSLGGNDQSSSTGDSGVWASREQGPGHNSALPPGGISIINLLSNEEVLSPPSRPKTPPRMTEKQASGSRMLFSPSMRVGDGGFMPSPKRSIPPAPSDLSRHESGHSSSSPRLAVAEKPGLVSSVKAAERRLEREFVRIYLNNLHHLHPMIDSLAFMARCEEEIWAAHTPFERRKDRRHFFALYNIVLAIGALIAGSSFSQEFGPDMKLCMEQSAQPRDSRQPITSQALSRSYFRKSRALLGDVFEVCSLESAQTLLLMSLYCQNSLKPHACYMYCGQAVRTALAIGLPNESMSRSVEGRKTARRTWWCIYSHEIDMSCSSGRRDSLGKPRNYQIPMPYIRSQHIGASDAPEAENNSVAMINEMVHFAAVLRRISKQIYHDSKGLTMLQKSTVATELDNLLTDWKSKLPEWLDFNKVCFREEESAAKQKLPLQLRYLNARILLHRPFLSASMTRGGLQTSKHVDLCLDAARETIRVLYESYANRHYFRTWWYNSTYTLYAGMIVLYIIMLGNTTVPSSELLSDVIKSRDILQSMDETTVARRSADLIREGLEVAQACVQHRQNPPIAPERFTADQTFDRSSGQMDLNDASFNADIDFSRTFFSRTAPGQDPGALLASLIDPNVLQDFTTGSNNMEFSTLPFDSSYGDWPDNDLASIMNWQKDGPLNHLQGTHQ